ncbi:hypothetical protein DFQ27_002372, partial [Actinomortierella ambigua]
MAGLRTRLPQSPIRHGSIYITEAQLFVHLSKSSAVAGYLYKITGTNIGTVRDRPPGWLLTMLVTPVGLSMLAPAHPHPLSRTTTTATVAELRALATNLVGPVLPNASSSEILMNARLPTERMFPATHVLQPGQPRNVLPSFLLRGAIVTDGRKLYLSAVDLRKRAKQRFITNIVNNTRQHVLAPDNRRLLPNISTAIPLPS